MLSRSTSSPKASPATKDPSERRQHARYSFTESMEAFEPVSQTRIQGRTADLSAGGCYVDSMNPFPAQTRLNVRITRGTRSIESQATVVYSVAGMGMGLRFEAIAPQHQTILKNWLAALSGESTREPEVPEKCDQGRRSIEAKDILNELVNELMRKGVLAEDTAQGMLNRLAPAA